MKINGFGEWTENFSCGVDSDFWIKVFDYFMINRNLKACFTNQISTYDIGAELGSLPGEIYWEGISIENRRILFTQWEDWFSVCTLICEDLAR